MDINSEFDRLENSGPGGREADVRDQKIAALLAHARSTTKQLDRMTCGMAELTNTLHEVGGLLKSQQKELARNTEITDDVRAAVAAGRFAGMLIRWAGYIGSAIAAVWAGLYAITHWGDKP